MLKITKKMVMATVAMSLAAAVFLCSCGQSSGKKMTNEEKAEFKQLQAKFKDYVVQNDPATGKPYDFDGLTVYLCDYWSNANGISHDEPGNQVAQDAADFRKYVNYLYNMNFDQKGISNWDNHPQAVSDFCLSGGSENYLFFVDNRSIGSGITAGLFYDINKIKNIDWKADKWAQSTFDLCSKGNSIYACRHLTPEPRAGLFFNKRILKEANIDPESIYDMQANGTWTWAEFERVLKATTRDVDNDGVIDVYGMANGSFDFCTLAAQSNGSTMIGKDASGKYYSNLGDDRLKETMNWVQEMVKNYEKPTPEGANWDWMYASFKNGETAFVTHSAYFARELDSVIDDFGYVAFPLGPNSDGKYKTLFNDNYVVLPSCYDQARAEKIMKAFDLWSDIVPGYSVETWKDEWYPHFRDERAVDETMQMMYENGEANLIHMITGINQLGDYIWNVYPGYITPEQGYEQTKNAYDALLKDMNK